MKRLPKTGVAALIVGVAGVAGLAMLPRAISTSGAPSVAVTPGGWTDFTLETPAGEQVSLNRYVGKKAVLLAFWATWCPHCNATILDLKALHSGPLSGRLKILAVDWKESRGKVASFAAAKEIPYTVLLDTEGRISRIYGIVGIPTYILIDREGKVVYRDNALPPSIEKYL
ncbi:MAG: TlpA family protein disulfide reductase [Deltaproteobacteria bacterium]|nr:TlpA family protein disulfide reductase [Deltaproteobacteria bacterium]